MSKCNKIFLEIENNLQILSIFSENFEYQSIIESPGEVVDNSKDVENISEPLTFVLVLQEVSEDTEGVVGEGGHQQKKERSVDVDGVLDGVGYGVGKLDCALESSSVRSSLLSDVLLTPGKDGN